MAQALEKIFLQKVALMPQEEVELLPPAPKGKGRKPGPGMSLWMLRSDNGAGVHVSFPRIYISLTVSNAGQQEGSVTSGSPTSAFPGATSPVSQPPVISPPAPAITPSTPTVQNTPATPIMPGMPPSQPFGKVSAKTNMSSLSTTCP